MYNGSAVCVTAKGKAQPCGSTEELLTSVGYPRPNLISLSGVNIHRVQSSLEVHISLGLFVAYSIGLDSHHVHRLDVVLKQDRNWTFRSDLRLPAPINRHFILTDPLCLGVSRTGTLSRFSATGTWGCCILRDLHLSSRFRKFRSRWKKKQIPCSKRLASDGSTIPWQLGAFKCWEIQIHTLIIPRWQDSRSKARSLLFPVGTKV